MFRESFLFTQSPGCFQTHKALAVLVKRHMWVDPCDIWVLFISCSFSSHASVSRPAVLNQSMRSLGQSQDNMANHLKRPLPVSPHVPLTGGPISKQKRMKLSVEISIPRSVSARSDTRSISARSNTRSVSVQSRPRPTPVSSPDKLHKPQAPRSNTIGALGISTKTNGILEKKTTPLGCCRVNESPDDGSR